MTHYERTQVSPKQQQQQQQQQQQRLRAMSREDVSKMSPSLLSSTSPASSHTGSTLRRSRQISRSYSVLAPWKPRHYREKFEITYSNKQQQEQEQPAGASTATPSDVVGGKPPRVPLRRYRDENDAPPKAANPVSRSSTMPKNTKVAGWFRSRKKKR